MKNRAIITSALPYANGEIHLGHVASTYIPADVTTRHLLRVHWTKGSRGVLRAL